MNFYQTGYYQLFNAATDAIRAIEQQNYGAAKEILIAAQLAAEEGYISQTQKAQASPINTDMQYVP